MEPRTFFSSEHLDGCLYGEKEYRKFCVTVDEYTGRPMLRVRHHGKGPDFIKLHDPAAALLVQLDEKPGIPWLAQAVLLNGVAMIQYTPLEPLESLDGESIPGLGEISAERTARAVSIQEYRKSQASTS